MRMSKYCFGIDVGGTTIKCALFLNDGTILDKWEIKTNTDNGGERISSRYCRWNCSKYERKTDRKNRGRGHWY